jgi:hypothetical protein
MTRARDRKRRYRPPSVITSDVDRRFSPSESDSDSSNQSHKSNISAVVLPKKRPRKATPPRVPPPAIAPAPNNAPAIPTVKAINVHYVTSIFSTAEMKKTLNKRVPKNASFQLQTDEPWDTFKVQLLVRITDALNPTTIDLANYNIMACISRIITKPGAPLNTEDEFTMFVHRLTSSKAKDGVLANVTITQLDDGNDKENIPEKDAGQSKKKSKDSDLLPGNFKKTSNVQALQERWVCQKKQPNCLGKYCFVFDDGTHLPLSNACLECWAFSMVRCPHPYLLTPNSIHR